jgi:hypothetical protein
LDKGADSISRRGFGFVIGKEEKHIDVGTGEEILAAVAAQSQQGDVLCRLGGEGAAPHLNQDPVDHRRTASNGRRAVAGPFTGLAHERHFPRILLPKIINRYSDWVHEIVCGLPQQEEFLPE